MKKLKIVMLVMLVSVSMVGCGKLDRFVAGITGDATEACVNGVAYLQFTSGATVKYNRDGSIATCN